MENQNFMNLLDALINETLVKELRQQIDKILRVVNPMSLHTRPIVCAALYIVAEIIERSCGAEDKAIVSICRKDFQAESAIVSVPTGFFTKEDEQ